MPVFVSLRRERVQSAEQSTTLSESPWHEEENCDNSWLTIVKLQNYPSEATLLVDGADKAGRSGTNLPVL